MTARRDPIPGRDTTNPVPISLGGSRAARRIRAAVPKGQVVEDHHRQATRPGLGPHQTLHLDLDLRIPVPHPRRRRLSRDLVQGRGIRRTVGPPLIGRASRVGFGIQDEIRVLEWIFALHARRRHRRPGLPYHAGGGNCGGRRGNDARARREQGEQGEQAKTKAAHARLTRTPPRRRPDVYDGMVAERTRG